MLLEAFAAYGYQVENLLDTSVNTAKQLDRAWIDMEALSMHPDKITQLLAIPSLHVLILCENVGISSRDPSILALTHMARAKVILMPRPVNIPDAAEWLLSSQTALAHGGRTMNNVDGVAVKDGSTDATSPAFHLAPPLGTTPEDEQAVNGMLHGGPQLRILLVDDNLVRTPR
jgi:hypothetical protein